MTRLHALQEWEGYVTSVNEDHFTANLIDITVGSRVPGEKVDMPMEKLSDADRERVEVGAVFRWVIGYQIDPTGSRKRVSSIVFRDRPWTEASRKEASAEASAMKAFFDERNGKDAVVERGGD